VRIVGGRHRGRRLEAPAGLAVRPTAGRTREALFNILEHGRLAADGTSRQGARVLDNSAAARRPRGLLAAPHATLWTERTASHDHASAARLDEKPTVSRADRPPPPAPARQRRLLDHLRQRSGRAAGTRRRRSRRRGLCVVELSAKEPFAPPAGFTALDERRYGKARLVFVRYGGGGERAAMADRQSVLCPCNHVSLRPSLAT
jgi:16S rRNA (guanine966-N2)-methyltransferase